LDNAGGKERTLDDAFLYQMFIELRPKARAVVGHGQRKQKQQEKHAEEDDHLGHFFAGALHVHEEQDNQNGLYGSDGERNDGIPRVQIHEGGTDCYSSQQEQGYQNAYVKTDGMFVF